MAAGLGFKTFNTGDVLSATDVNGYLMQGVLVFASAAARDAAITSPQEGQFAYLKDTNVTTYYTGSAWANLDTTGMTNPMTTTGDTIYSSSGSTPARLGIGSTGQVLTVASGVPTWSSPAAGGSMTLLSTTDITASSSVTVSSISQSYKHLLVEIWGNRGGNDGTGIKINSSVGPAAGQTMGYSTANSYYASGGNGYVYANIFDNSPSYDASTTWAKNYGFALFKNYSNTDQMKWVETGSAYVQNDVYVKGTRGSFFFNVTAAITQIVYQPYSGSFDAVGQIKIYGVN